MGIKDSKIPGFTGLITDVRFEVKDFDDGPALRLNVEYEGNEYPDWYTCGSAEHITVTDGGHKWSHEDGFEFSRASQGIKLFLLPLVTLVEKAGIPYDDSLNDLSQLIGIKVRNEKREFTTKYQGKTYNRVKAVPVEIVEGPSTARAASVKKEALNEPEADLDETLVKVLEANDGEVEVAAITAKALAAVLGKDVSYKERKALAKALTEPSYLESQEVAEVDGGTLTFAA